MGGDTKARPLRYAGRARVEIIPPVNAYQGKPPARLAFIALGSNLGDSRVLVRQATERLEQLFGPSRQRLVSCPLYISLDKDVMVQADAFVNWDSGHLHLAEVQTILQWFISASNGNLAGMDIVGDWSPVQVSGLPRRVLGWIEHPRLAVDPVATDRRNERTNLALLELVSRLGATGAMLSRPLHVLATE